MPTQKIVNNLPTLNKTTAHWNKIETLLGEAVTLPGSMTRDGAIDLASAIQTAETSLIHRRVALTNARQVRTKGQKAIHDAARQARKSMRGLAKGLPDTAALPNLPAANSAPATLLELYTEIARVWERLNALPPASIPAARLPLRIPLEENNVLVQLTLAQFEERIEALRVAAERLAEAESAVTEGIAERNDLHDQAAVIVKDYAGVARALLPETHALLTTIPTLSGG